MGMVTEISWCDSTVNQEIGCAGCELWTSKVHKCYAGRLVEKYGGQRGWPKSFDKPMIFPERIPKACEWSDLTGKDRKGKPWLNGLPRIIFLDDMGDTWTESLAVDWLLPYISMMEESPHIWMFLTKRPKRMAQFFKMLGRVPENFWLGTSVTDQGTARARIPELLKIKDALLYLSVEPQYEYIDFGDWIGPDFLVQNSIRLFINGGESGPGYSHFNANWMRRNRDLCQQANISFFAKQLGGYPDKREAWDKLPEDLRIREMPIQSPQKKQEPGQFSMF